MVVLVTGGAGFIGSHLVKQLIKLGFGVVVVDDLSTGKLSNIPDQARFYELDTTEPELEDVFQGEKPSTVFHLAAQSSVRISIKDPLLDVRNNIQGSINVFELSKKHGVKNIIFASSGGVLYGEASLRPTPENSELKPFSPYGVSKLAAEAYLDYIGQLHGIKAVSLRFANVYGERQNLGSEASVVVKFIDQLLKEKPPAIHGDGEQTRDFVYVADVIEACIQAWQQNLKGTYNVGTGEGVSVNEFYQLLTRLLGFKREPVYKPAIAGEVKHSALDASKLSKKTGWRPKVNLEEGLQRTIAWLKGKNRD